MPEREPLFHGHETETLDAKMGVLFAGSQPIDQSTNRPTDKPTYLPTLLNPTRPDPITPTRPIPRPGLIEELRAQAHHVRQAPVVTPYRPNGASLRPVGGEGCWGALSWYRTVTGPPLGARFRVVSRNATANLTLVELQMDSPCALRRPEQLNFFERGGQNRVQPILSIGSQ